MNMMSSIAIQPATDLIEQQEMLETEMTSQGIARFRASIESAREYGREDSTVYGMKLLDGLIDRVAQGIMDFIASRETGKAGRKGPTYKYLKLFDEQFDVVAFIALRLMLAGLTAKPTSVPMLAGRIGRAVEDEYRYRGVREADRKFYEQLRAEADRRSAYEIKRKVVNLFIARREMDLPDAWPEADAVLLGHLLIEIVIEQTGLAQKQKIEVGAHNSKVVLVPTEETRKFIADRVASAEVMRPLYEPMVIPPVDWTSPFNGGYLTRRVRPLRLVKSFNRKYLMALESQDMSEVTASVNAAQRTAWAINPFILTVLDMAWEKDFSLGGIPTLYNAPLPPKPHDIDTNEVARKEWRGEAHLVHMENLEMTSKRASFTTTLGIAHRYSLFPAIYFPYQLDFRGRIYAAPMLNPQGPDWMYAPFPAH